MAGYASTPLAKKLGIKPGHRVLLLNPPAGFDEALDPLPERTRVLTRARNRVDIIVCCCHRHSELRRRLPGLLERLPADGGLWLGWPKKSSGLTTDLSFDAVQTEGLATGLVDNKICALDDQWSGLRFVVRKENRAGWCAR